MTVNLSQIILAAEARRASVAGEVAGYLILAAADQLLKAPRGFEAADLTLDERGEVSVGRGAACESERCGELLRTYLGELLGVSRPLPPALLRATRRSGGVAELVRELEAGLIPVNRAAARRALSRLSREVSAALPSLAEANAEPGRVAPVQGHAAEGRVAPRAPALERPQRVASPRVADVTEAPAWNRRGDATMRARDQASHRAPRALQSHAVSPAPRSDAPRSDAPRSDPRRSEVPPSDLRGDTPRTDLAQTDPAPPPPDVLWAPEVPRAPRVPTFAATDDELTCQQPAVARRREREALAFAEVESPIDGLLLADGDATERVPVAELAQGFEGAGGFELQVDSEADFEPPQMHSEADFSPRQMSSRADSEQLGASLHTPGEAPRSAPSREPRAEPSVASMLAPIVAPRSASSATPNPQTLEPLGPRALGSSQVRDRQSDVQELLTGFQVAETRSDLELSRVLKSMAGIDLTPLAPRVAER
ncbi:MAG: hypothetical protein KIT72_10770 [Polyangiaceae bacterium]|nr:hypothetical protein [Polyangiaceae bacterium]MCW5790895.1 hypothetical protein [Polyangiaceae bacterium]